MERNEEHPLEGGSAGKGTFHTDRLGTADLSHHRDSLWRSLTTQAEYSTGDS
jgi:hypothetical protein